MSSDMNADGSATLLSANTADEVELTAEELEGEVAGLNALVIRRPYSNRRLIAYVLFMPQVLSSHSLRTFTATSESDDQYRIFFLFAGTTSSSSSEQVAVKNAVWYASDRSSCGYAVFDSVLTFPLSGRITRIHQAATRNDSRLCMRISTATGRFLTSRGTFSSPGRFT